METTFVILSLFHVKSLFLASRYCTFTIVWFFISFITSSSLWYILVFLRLLEVVGLQTSSSTRKCGVRCESLSILLITQLRMLLGRSFILFSTIQHTLSLVSLLVQLLNSPLWRILWGTPSCLPWKLIPLFYCGHNSYLYSEQWPSL